MKNYLLSTTAILLMVPSVAQAADQDPSGEIIVTGTRQTGMRAADSAAPIQMIGKEAFQSVGQQDLTQVLAQSLPSLNFQGFGGDTANLTLSAALRGISPNDTLVLINGKRRHTTANLSVLGGSPYSGSATTDLSFIPTNAIGHIEVLQDGAAAQYGSDAIAGVVNIQLKNNDHGGVFTATGGSNYENGGATAATAVNLGFKLGEKGFLNVTGEYKFHDYTQHGRYDRRFFNPDGSLIPGQSAVVVNGLQSNSKYPNVNTINGDSRYSLFNFSFNAGYDIGSDAQAYAFGSYGNRVSRAYENYRSPSKIWGNPATMVNGALVPGSIISAGANAVYPLASGFQPQESSREEDFSVTAGIKGKAFDWNYDLSGTYGKDAVGLYTLNSANAGVYALLQSASTTPMSSLQRNFYDGQLSNSEWVVNLDLNRDFEVGLTKPVTVALGAEYRNGNYSIAQGEWASYIYGGAQSYPGFAPTDAGSYGRNSWAGYVDVAFDPIKNWHIDLAGRYETYSDFGGVWIGKANGRYDFNDKIAIRGTVSNGFRAPTLAEEYYSSVNVGPGSTFGQLPANSPAAQLLGFSKLKPERSVNYSAGIVLHPLPKLQITVDAYQIKIKNRIVPSGDIYGSYGATNGVPTPVAPAVLAALTSRGVSYADATSYAGINIYNNGVSTRTRGIEATANYASDFGEYGKVDWSVGFNYNQTDITKINALPAAVYAAGYNTLLLTQNAKDALTTATPRVKVIANALWNIGKFSVNLRETIYGSTGQHISTDGAGNCATGNTATCMLLKTPTTFITDLNVGYKLTRSLRIDVGANNLFDHGAKTLPTVYTGTAYRPLNGNVYASPASFTPWGINGGYYYGRVTFTF